MLIFSAFHAILFLTGGKKNESEHEQEENGDNDKRGAHVGMAAKSMMKPKKRKLAKSASKAIGAVGETMQNISSFLK